MVAASGAVPRGAGKGEPGSVLPAGVAVGAGTWPKAGTADARTGADDAGRPGCAAGGSDGGAAGAASGRDPAQAGGRLDGGAAHAERGWGESVATGGTSDRAGEPADDHEEAGHAGSCAGAGAGAAGTGAADARCGRCEPVAGCDGVGGATEPRLLVGPLGLAAEAPS